MQARASVMLVLLVACEREGARARKEPTEPCLADELGTMRSEWQVPEFCESDLTRCRQACVEGEGEACFYVATKNTAIETDDEEDPMPLFERGCHDGLAIACTNWAAGHVFGRRGNKHPAMACLYRVFAKTCEADDPFGCSMTARIHLEWPRTVADKWIGFNELTNACNRFAGPPCRFLAYYLERGDFGDSDPDRIKQLLQRACDGDDEEACGKQTAADALR